jgi:Stress responsive A/B Barrel Domain
MIKHIVVFKFKADATAAQRKQLVDALNALPALIPDVKKWKFEYCIPGRTGRHMDFALFCQFEDVAALDRYIVHPEHQKVVKLVDAYCESRAGFDYE